MLMIHLHRASLVIMLHAYEGVLAYPMPAEVI